MKFVTALIGISSIHLLQTFIEADRLTDRRMMWQVTIHLTFVISAFMLAWTDRVASASAAIVRATEGKADEGGDAHAA